MKRVTIADEHTISINEVDNITQSSPENSADTESELLADGNENSGNMKSNEYRRKLKSYRQNFCTTTSKTGQATKIYCINEHVLLQEFYGCVNEMLEELRVDISRNM